MKYRQKKGKNIVEIEFLENKIKYFLQDDGSSGSFDIRPETISKDTITFLEKNNGFKNYSIYLLIIGLVFAFMTFFLKIFTFYIPFLLGSIIMVTLYRLSFVKYTIIETTKKKIYIIQDKNHDEIVKKIFDMRNQYYKDIYFKFIPENNVKDEADKFKWLLDEEIITQAEYQSVLSEIQHTNTTVEN
ncbi:hypothetical protein KBD81_00795 [Candidatus Woesebacteria bacterium]|nr:hypothetical protein [Candidatus Woesebacteria bacterium]